MSTSKFIRNAQIATSTEVFTGSVLVENGKIARVYHGYEQPLLPPGTEVFEATGKLLLPGGVDAHTHFDINLGYTRTADDFYTGTVAAACGGTTTVINHMGFGPESCALARQPHAYRQMAQNAVVDYGLHGMVQHVDDATLGDMALLRDAEGISSLGLSLSGDYRLDDEALLRVLRRAKELGLTLCLHCENDAASAALKRDYTNNACTSPRYHALSHPPEAEAEAVFRSLMLAKMAGDARVYILHLSTALGLNAVHLARSAGQQNIFAETCPQYLLLNDALYGDTAEGLKYVAEPPLRAESDRTALWSGLSAGEVDAIGSDHRPFFFAAQKQRGREDFTLCPGGMPGAELRMALMFSQAYGQGFLSLPELVRLCCTGPAEIFGLAPQKGDIREGADADLVLFDPELRWTVEKSLLHENVDYTPYEGMVLTGKPMLTLSRGAVIAANGHFIGRPGHGQYLRRRAATNT